MDWGSRGITRLGIPPPDIWDRLLHPARTPQYREEWYKFLFNALPLGHRISRFAPEDANCHACPTLTQTLRHFILSCPVAQEVWREFRRVFQWHTPITLEQAAFAWPSRVVHLGRRYGFQLQAGHAVVLHTIWVTHTRARYANTPAHPAAIRALFRSHLLRYLETQYTSFHAKGHAERFWRNWQQTVIPSPRSFSKITLAH
jgi:hypothetical protein